MAKEILLMYNAMDDLIDWLFDFAKKKNIAIIVEDDWHSDWPSQAQKDFRCVMYNPNWLPVCERPVSLAHEIGHVLADDPVDSKVFSNVVKEKAEDSGNQYAVLLLLEYCRTHDITFETKAQLAECFRIPSNMMHNVDRAITYFPLTVI